MKILEYSKTFFANGNARTIAMKRNVLYMLLIKGCSIFLGMFTVPLTLGYVNNETYGLWLTISSMISWMSYFDIGINNGLKNNLAAAFAKNDFELGKRLVSTTYAVLILIFIPIMVYRLRLHFKYFKRKRARTKINSLYYDIILLYTIYTVHIKCNIVGRSKAS